ncbi:MAG: hypothetical protein Q8R22_14175 [Flavobacterium sp.]|jgi:hypothetical protein|uniref:hypothetical protein n=1 Tax=unclassified Flavobacterium TaxID=196869 RepID=UPI00265FE069|nr:MULTISPECIES: hypothetical protein [unclassified Flavobacterium]MDP3681973.1 hypothetical protein [Flavobacterium sp.]WKL42419.1 hypothetical protein Q1W72_08565 [Flavobacterium sp. ZE23DGlu08]
MKKTILILIAILAVCAGSYYYYMQSDKKMINDFACDVTNGAIKLEDVINKYLLYNKDSKEITLMQLEYIRTEYRKNPSNNITVSSYEDAVEQKKVEDHIVSEDYDNVFIIFVNDKIQIPILLNANSKIIAISTINKGGPRFFMRLDGKKD